ncbi:DUF1016 family protein [Cryobacterium sp. TMT3-29-2]|nr:DUF1016 family protein [Cryobacterium sp. TMT3-29-2]
MLNQIKNRTLERAGAASSNFSAELAPADFDLARQIAKDPYVFDFLELTEDAAERDLEQALMDRTVLAWFQSMSPELGDHSPAALLRVEPLDEIGLRVISAAPSFAAQGSPVS